MDRATQEEAATAYDMAAIEYRGLNAVTNFDLSRYIKWLRPNADNQNAKSTPIPTPLNVLFDQKFGLQQQQQQQQQQMMQQQQEQHDVSEISPFPQPRAGGATALSALGLLLQSSKFKEMLQRTSADGPSSPPDESERKPSRCSFPDDIQTYFEHQDTGSYGHEDDDDAIFGDINVFVSPIYELEF